MSTTIPTARALTRVGRLLAIVLAVTAAIVGGEPTTAGALTPTPPPPIPAGQLGGDGPCSSMPVLSAPVQQFPTSTVAVYRPTGAAVPRTGGSCNDNSRPVIFLAHGYACDVTPPPADSSLINNLVSNGYVAVFSTYPCGWDANWQRVDAGYVQATTSMGQERMNLAHVGFFGHSWGGGMAPRLLVAGANRGWGSGSRWVAMYAATDGCGVCWFDPIVMPANTKVLAVVYEQDQIVHPAALSHHLYQRLTGPGIDKRFVTVKTDCRGQNPCPENLVADHFTPVRTPLSHLNYYGTHRNVHAIAECARFGTTCATSASTFMGTWSDGVAAIPATVII